MLPQEYIQFIDLTSLNDDDSDAIITTLCQRALAYHTAAVCVYPQFVALAAAHLKGSPSIQIATVVNFPSGHLEPQDFAEDIRKAIKEGATEIDFVVPWQRFKVDHDSTKMLTYLQSVVEICGNTTTKAILESSELADEDLAEVAKLALQAGVNFLKTSTGKVPGGGATVKAAKIILQAIKEHGSPTSGFKASGGVRTAQDVEKYINVITDICGADFLTPSRFRIGASGLLDNLINKH